MAHPKAWRGTLHLALEDAVDDELISRPAAIRVEWQLYELDSGEFWRCPPKDDGYRTIGPLHGSPVC